MAKRIPKRLSPLETCYPWQGRWVADDARWKFGLWGRQEGTILLFAAGSGCIGTGCRVKERR